MNDQKKMLSRWIDEDRDILINFFSRFIQAKSPNPPGDTRTAAAHICDFLDEKGLPYQVIAPQEEMPNIVGSFECEAAGRHLVLNGHIDVFPVGDVEDWTYDPWGGTVAEGRIYGRGAADMKAGTTASIFTYAYLHRIRDKLKGKLTLTCVSDEETFGKWGTHYLMENHPEVHGDCCLNGEPSSPYTIRFGEKGLLWIAFTVQTPGAHGAYPHVSPSATKIAGRLMSELEALSEIKASTPDNIATALKGAEEIIDRAYGKGAAKIIDKVTVNVGMIYGGLKVNMIPGQCTIESDIRLPVGLDKEGVMAEIEKICSKYHGLSYREINYTPPSSCDPNGDMVHYLRANAHESFGIKPLPIISLGGTDARLWRYKNIPAYVYGPSPSNIGSADEHVEVEEFLNILRTHVLSAFDYLNESEIQKR
jgi:succinyl-diaminopimelate desuccinylase